MSEVYNEERLNQALKTKNALMVLFYATWCPFSQRFLPIYLRCTAQNTTCIRVAVDDLPELCDKYNIEVYPTVIYFQKGNIANRLDGAPGAGLTENQLKKLLETYKT